MSDKFHKTLKAVPNTLIELEKSKTAQFLGRVFGDTIENGVGIIGDRLKHMRLNQAVKLHKKTEKALKAKGVEPKDYRKLAAKIGIPLIENATLEENEELHTLWANLLANALDPNFSGDISIMHVSLLKEMMPVDVKILHMIYNEKQQHRWLKSKLDDVRFSRALIAKSLKTDIDKIEISLLNLMRLGCIKGGNIKTGGIKIGNTSNTIYLGTEEVHLSALGVELCEAAIVN
jgi:hypothetical protein